jgi:hypothetical protein
VKRFHPLVLLSNRPWAAGGLVACAVWLLRNPPDRPFS